MALRTMTIATLIAFNLVVFCMPVAAGRSPSLNWTLQMEDRKVRATTVDKMGNVVMIGCGDHSEWYYCKAIFVTKVSAHGEEVWTYQEESVVWESPSAVAVNDLGDVFITGTTTNLTEYFHILTTAQDLFVRCIRANGTHSWTYQAGTGVTFSSHPRAIALDKAGDVIIAGVVGFESSGWVLGSLPGSSGFGPVFGMKLRADGEWAWTTQYHPGSTIFHSGDRPAAITADLDDNIFVAWSDVTNKILPDGTLDVTRDVTTDLRLAWLIVKGITFDKVGDVIIVGVERGPHARSDIAILVKTLANGTQAWRKEVYGITPGPGVIAPGPGIAVDSESNLYIFDVAQSSVADVVQVRADGSLGWTFDMGKALFGDFKSTAVGVDEQGDVFVTGSLYSLEANSTDSTGNYQVSKIKTNMGVEESSSSSSTVEPVEVSDTTVEISSASRGAGAERSLVAVTGFLLVLSQSHTQEMEQP